jgi:hypothetical protein
MAAGRHSKKEVGEVLRGLPDHLVVVATDAGHRWGYVECTRCGDRLSVWSTPRSPGNHAKDIARFALRHDHPELKKAQHDKEGEAK